MGIPMCACTESIVYISGTLSNPLTMLKSYQPRLLAYTLHVDTHDI